MIDIVRLLDPAGFPFFFPRRIHTLQYRLFDTPDPGLWKMEVKHVARDVFNSSHLHTLRGWTAVFAV